MKIVIKNLSFAYSGRSVFEGFSLELGEESPLIIMGPSGCGKTTLLRLAASLLAPDAGAVAFEGASGEAVSFVFQEPRLLPWLTARENVSLPLKRLLGEQEARARAERFLDMVGLADRQDAFPGNLSGGQQQRVSIARGFAYPSAALFMDEPFQALDMPLRFDLMDRIKRFYKEETEKNRLIVAVTHDPREAAYLGARVVVLGKSGGVALDRAGAPEADLLEALRDGASG